LKALKLYLWLISIQIRSQMQYRIGFLLETASVALGSIISFVTLALVLQKFEGIAGWSLGEVAFLFALVELSFGLMDMIFSGFDPDYFAAHTRLGTLDQYMLRPVSLTLQVFGSQFILRRLGRIFQGVVILLFAIQLLNIEWTLGKILYLPFVIAGMVLFFGGLFMFGATITFWTVERIEAVNILTYGGTELMSYPMTIYQDWMRHFFTFIVPAIFLNYYPALYFLDRSDPFNMPNGVHFIAPVVGLGVFMSAYVFWSFGVRHYQSTGT
jgi:ABC-2 type transport system permease protein